MSDSGIRLYSYWRSSAAYRVRIALHLKGLPYQLVPVNIAPAADEQHAAAFTEINSQQLVPVLIDGGRVIRQSLAIIEYIEEMYDGPRLLPVTTRERARARGLAMQIACDIHPLNNLRVLDYLEQQGGMPKIEREQWVRHWITLGFTALEEQLLHNPSTGDFCEGDAPSIADCCLVPQLYNARRWSVDLAPFPTMLRIEKHCLAVPAFEQALPENQPDAPKS